MAYPKAEIDGNKSQLLCLGRHFVTFLHTQRKENTEISTLLLCRRASLTPHT